MMGFAKDYEASVLIVGAGPSGLMMAHELARYGISAMLIERNLEKSPYSRAIGVQIRSLEIFSALGLFDELKKKSQEVNEVQIFSEGRKKITIEIKKVSPFFGGVLVVDQPHTEKVLEDSLKKLGPKILRGISLVDFERKDSKIVATLLHQDGKKETRDFSYIVGACGTNSMVRKRMSSAFLGSIYQDAFILADAECIQPYDHKTLRIFFKQKHFLATIPMFGENHFRLISVRRGETEKKGEAPKIEEFSSLAKKVVPFLFEIKSKTWVSRFFVQCKSASKYQEGKAFLIGDAAHIHSPAGAQGMNTGLQDAFNLAFKLAMVIKDIAKPKLLETYQSERKPVGDFLIDRTDRLFKFMVRSSIFARLLRLIVLPIFAKSQKLTLRFAKLASQTAIRYESGALCAFDDHLTISGIEKGVRIPNLNLITNQIKKIDLHSMISELKFSFIFFFPNGLEKKTVKFIFSSCFDLQQNFKHSLKTIFIFRSDYDAEKIKNNCDYAVASDFTKIFDMQEPFFIVARPDHHIFCLGLLDHIDHAKKSLNLFLI